jgi:sialate O-acetylesterase
VLAQNAALPFVSNVFSDHMVLQRDQVDRIWGWSSPGRTVTVGIDARTATALAGPDGKWLASFSAPPTGGPYQLKVSDGSQTVTLSDVLVGDVWLCSGQSNMEFGVGMLKDPKPVIAAADNARIRLFLADHQTSSLGPRQTVPGTWKTCTPANIANGGWSGFSAVGYFFGSEIQSTVGVPVGLLQIAWGGTGGEAWASEEGLLATGVCDEQIRLIRKLRAQGVDMWNDVDPWEAEHDPGTIGRYEKLSTSDQSWHPVTFPVVPTALGVGAKGAGTSWYMSNVNLSGTPPSNAMVHLGWLNGYDRAYVNGKLVGWGGWSWERQYGIPAGTLKQGTNTVMVRLVSENDTEGMQMKPADTWIQVGDQKVPLGSWVAKPTSDFGQSQPNSFTPVPCIAGVLSNGMVSPVAPMAVKGAIWYQGETNVGRAKAYRRILHALMTDWRRQFMEPEMPFYIVSLAAYLGRGEQPGDDAWAELREAQAMAAAEDPDSGLALTIDVGDANDIHPKDKKTVGHRLASIALNRVYGRSNEFLGPVYDGFAVNGGEVTVSFEHAAGLKASDLGHNFALAGADHVWHWAEASIAGEAVVLRCPDVPHPVAVRYAWQSNPRADLYNGAGYPAVPFRTDDW